MNKKEPIRVGELRKFIEQYDDDTKIAIAHGGAFFIAHDIDELSFDGKQMIMIHNE